MRAQAEFQARYERAGVPVVITGLCEGARCAHAWTPEQLEREFGDWHALVGRGQHKVGPFPQAFMCEP